MDDGKSYGKGKSEIEIKSRRKRKRKSKGIVNFWCRREVLPLSLARCSAISNYLVLGLDIHQRSVRHRGPVMTVSFSPDGDTLVSGSTDGRVKLSNWETGQVNVSFQSGHYDHHDSLLQVQIMPWNQKIVTCSHHEVKLATIGDGEVQTKLLEKTNVSFRMIATSPASPNDFYICSSDGLVRHVDMRMEETRVLLSSGYFLWGGDVRRLPLSTMAINVDPNIFVVGGPNKFAQLFDIRNRNISNGFHQPIDRFCPSNLIGKEAEISGVTFSQQGELLVSYRQDSIYLFSSKKGMGPHQELHDSRTSLQMSPPYTMAYKGHENTEFGRNVTFISPNSDHIISGSDCRRIFVWKKDNGKLVRVLEGNHTLTVGSHPHLPVVATCGAARHAVVWTPKDIKATLPEDIPEPHFHDDINNLPCHYPQEYVRILDNSNDGSNDDDNDGEEEDSDIE